MLPDINMDKDKNFRALSNLKKLYILDYKKYKRSSSVKNLSNSKKKENFRHPKK